MNNTVREDLFNALNDLLEKQFQDFKWWLKDIDHNGKSNIPTAHLEKANQRDVVDLLIQHYGEDALQVCIHVLQKSNINDVARKLEETLQKGTEETQLQQLLLQGSCPRLQPVTDVCFPASVVQPITDAGAHQLPASSNYRNYIKKKFATIKDPNAIPGEYVPLNQRYSNLIVLDYHPSEEERENQILAMGRKHFEIISKRAESSISIETLFNPDKYGLIPQVVVLQGAAGIGKTIMTKKIMFDWASQLLYQDKFDYAFYISNREINLHAESQKTSIVEIISSEWLKCHEVNNVIRNILKNEEKLLFIIDGIDELRYSFDQSENYFCTDPWKKEPVRIILSSLFKKKLLPKSSLIITTRLMALEKLHRCLEQPRNFEILGFSTQEREEYFYKFFENEDQAMQAFRFVKQNDMLFTMCVIPLVSWIICTVMKQEMERGKDLQKAPCTLTAIYVLYFSSLLKFHHKESKRDVQTNVKGLCALAAEGVLKQQIMFMKEEVRKHNLDQGDSLPLFLNQNLFKRDIDCIQTYSFIHLSFQEFFAALFYILDEREEQHSQTQNKNFQTLLESHQPFRRDFAVGFRFLFGFLNEEKRMRQLKKEFEWEICPKNKVFLLNWVKYKIDKTITFHWQKDMLTYLYETQDDNFVSDALCSVTDINLQCNSDMGLMILAYCVQHCRNLGYLTIELPIFSCQEEGELFLPKTE
ncbi:NACHT, LRR and PYD domains-containing protein 6 [Notechis scutatus]|uniref:NACHT, LRR and PYD domains-containing protein 6 n=1 Tax=Notechis scutatus TaxID=8663 RepID=A0A6J1VFQ4_9SAUR|nr:NACHT, LRR and PYD domains-containing protein 6 [Notechis scutatus]